MVIIKHFISKKLKLICSPLLKYWLLIFYITSITYLELVYRLWNFRSISYDYAFPVLFAFSEGSVLLLISGIIGEKANKAVAALLTLMLVMVFSIQLVYFSIFHMPLSIYSMTRAGAVMQFKDIIISAILKNIIGVILLFIPFIFLLVLGRKHSYSRIKLQSLFFILIFCAATYTISIACVNLTDTKNTSQRTLYHNIISPEISVIKLGLITTMRLDFERLVFGFGQNDSTEGITVKNTYDSSGTAAVFNYSGYEDEEVLDSSDTGTGLGSSGEWTIPADTYNTMNINFENLITNEKDQTLLDMHKYFCSLKPTKKNEYTGFFKENNLILITAESFSPYFISPELTPTLYRMSTQGFVFKNFYNPVWGVSTSDGEYVACTGLVPKSGIWSFARSGENYMPFALGNQFRRLGYITKAYHNHTYDYYDRNISHPNMGYDYKGIGNGLELKETWPESDEEMVKVTGEDFIGHKPFHVYYMTVSGHMNYNFDGNYIAGKNQSFVEHLNCSEASKAYIACSMELEFAMKSLLERLESAGAAKDTVIAISADHYPYGLPKECIDELAGHEVDDNFELYKSSFILWKEGMETVFIDKPCSSLDIIPTLSNLFGLQYDSRLLAGSDILSDAPSVVIFSNRSWITDKAMYNAVTNTPIYMDDTKGDTDYVKKVNGVVADKFRYSAKVLDMDYYRVVIPN